jgi:ankyrin repeat protein
MYKWCLKTKLTVSISADLEKYLQVLHALSTAIKDDGDCPVVHSIPGYGFRSISALGVAAIMNATQDIDSLVEAGCDPNYNGTYVTYTTTKCSSPLLEKLGINCTKQEKADGYTPLHLGVLVASDAVVQKLVNVPGIDLDAKSDEAGPAVYDAAAKGKLAMVKALGSSGADLNNVGGPQQISPLARAVIGEHREVVRYLISQKVNINLRGLDGSSAVFYAAHIGNLEVMKMLSQAGGDLEMVGGKHKGSPLTAAAAQGNLEVVEFLISQQVDLDAKGDTGYNAVFAAALEGGLEVLRVLQAAGANLDIPVGQPDSDLRLTALEVAINVNKTNIALFLIENGADVGHHDADGSTPAFYAATKGNLVVLKSLALAGGDLKTPGGPNDVTPLAAAAAYGFKDMVEFLLNKQVPIDSRDKLGKTAMDWALEGGYTAIARRLQRSM